MNPLESPPAPDHGVSVAVEQGVTMGEPSPAPEQNTLSNAVEEGENTVESAATTSPGLMEMLDAASSQNVSISVVNVGTPLLDTGPRVSVVGETTNNISSAMMASTSAPVSSTAFGDKKPPQISRLFIQL